MKTPIHAVLHSISRLPAKHKQAHLRRLIDAEPKRSVRRREFESAARDVITRQIQFETPSEASTKGAHRFVLDEPAFMAALGQTSP